jgi:hypothetical protein
MKKNLLKIPDIIKSKVALAKGKNLVVSCIVKIKPGSIREGKWKHVGIVYDGDKVVFPASILPSIKTGRYSKYNIRGRDIVHKELGLEPRTYTFETPDFGDWSKGSHDVDITRMVYPRDFIPPKHTETKIELVGQDDHGLYIFKFTIDEVLNESQAGFLDDLLVDLNLLQEIIGNHGVYPTDASLQDYLKSLYVSWEILPIGEMEENVTRILSGIRTTDPQIRQRLMDRWQLLTSLRPRNMVYGTSGFQRYFGAQFADDLVVFENVEYGNAIYIMFEDWPELSQKTRMELLAGPADKFVRIPHQGKWKPKLQAVVRKELRKRRK